MNKEEILHTYLLANIPEIISKEEFDNVKGAIKELLSENKELKEDIRLNESVFVGLLDKTIKYQELIKKVIKIIEDDYYSKNTVDIDSVSIPNNKLIQIREILKGDVDG